jgi:integral membrane sensor domain MASE1
MARIGPKTRGILAFAGTAATALLLSLLAIELTRLRGGISLLWLANAPLLATLCLVPQRRWAGHMASWFMGAVAAAMFASPIGKAAPIGAAINLCEIILALVLLRRADIARDPFENGPALAQFVLVVATTTALSGIAGAGVSHALLGIPLAQTWLDWVMAHSMGYLIAMPLAV